MLTPDPSTASGGQDAGHKTDIPFTGLDPQLQKDADLVTICKKIF